LAGVLFFFGVAAKENPLTLIAVIPIIVHLFAKKDWGTSLKVSAPFFVAAFFYLALRTNILDKDNSSGVNMIVNNIVWGAKGPQILSTNLSVWLEYLRLLIFPHPLSYDYSFNQIPLAGWDSPRVWLSLLAYIGIFVGGGYLVYKKNLVGLGLLFYGFTFAIFSNIIPKFVLASTLAERFMFMPSLGYCMAVVLGLYYLVQKISAAQTANIVIALCAIVGLGYSYLTIQRNPVWESNATLFGSGISTSPESFRTHYNIGEILRVEGELKKQAAVAKKDNAAIQQANAMLKQAGVHYKNSLNIYPKNDNNWYNLGICYINNNDTLEAEKAFQKSLDVNPKNGLSANNLGVIYFWKKNYPKAIEIFELAVKGQNPQIGNAYSNLGAAYHNMGNSAKAIENYEKALTYSQGKNIPLYQNLANIYNSLGNKEKAEQYMRMMK
jgi:Flp pilus assembly protein TadD